MAELTARQLGLTAIRGRLLLPREIAPLLRVSERWIRDHMQKKTFPIRWYFINDKDRAVDSADLNDWIAKKRVEPGTAPLPTKALNKILAGGKGVIA